MQTIETLAGALHDIGYRWADELIERGLQRLRSRRGRPAPYVGRHRAPSTIQRLAASWRATAQHLADIHEQARARRDADRASLDGLVQWWETRRADYAWAYERADARWVAV
jgi:hypothetical protein